MALSDQDGQKQCLRTPLSVVRRFQIRLNPCMMNVQRRPAAQNHFDLAASLERIVESAHVHDVPLAKRLAQTFNPKSRWRKKENDELVWIVNNNGMDRERIFVLFTAKLLEMATRERTETGDGNDAAADEEAGVGSGDELHSDAPVVAATPTAAAADDGRSADSSSPSRKRSRSPVTTADVTLDAAATCAATDAVMPCTSVPPYYSSSVRFFTKEQVWRRLRQQCSPPSSPLRLFDVIYVLLFKQLTLSERNLFTSSDWIKGAASVEFLGRHRPELNGGIGLRHKLSNLEKYPRTFAVMVQGHRLAVQAAAEALDAEESLDTVLPAERVCNS